MPKPPSTWKGKESDVGALFGSRRTALSGSNNTQAETRSDTDNKTYYLEVKFGTVGRYIPASIVVLWRETVRLAKLERKVPIVAICPKRGRHWPNGSGLGLGITSIERLAALERLAAAVRAANLDRVSLDDRIAAALVHLVNTEFSEGLIQPPPVVVPVEK